MPNWGSDIWMKKKSMVVSWLSPEPDQFPRNGGVLSGEFMGSHSRCFLKVSQDLNAAFRLLRPSVTAKGLGPHYSRIGSVEFLPLWAVSPSLKPQRLS